MCPGTLCGRDVKGGWACNMPQIWFQTLSSNSNDWTDLLKCTRFLIFWCMVDNFRSEPCSWKLINWPIEALASRGIKPNSPGLKGVSRHCPANDFPCHLQRTCCYSQTGIILLHLQFAGVCHAPLVLVVCSNSIFEDWLVGWNCHPCSTLAYQPNLH